MVDRRKGSKLYPIISGEHRDIAAGAVRKLLGAMSTAYYHVYRARMNRYMRREKLDLGVPVISIGNITLGGTGKTPVCRFLVRKFEKEQMKVGIASRGYGREGEGTAILKPDSTNVDWHHFGDEPLLFLRGAKNVTVAVDTDRAMAAKTLYEDYGCDLILLDDGFQFVTLGRDLDIVVIDALNPFGFDKLVPAGLLREPVESLARADVLWIAKADIIGKEQRSELITGLQENFPGKPIIESCYSPVGFSPLNGCTVDCSIESIMGQKALCVSGIGNPEAFEAIVERLTGRRTLSYRFTDHHPFSDSDLSDVEDEAIRQRADVIVTTEKDAVRIPRYFNPGCKWQVLEVEVHISRVHGSLDRFPLVACLKVSDIY